MKGNKIKPLKSILSNKNSTESEFTNETNVFVKPGCITRVMHNESVSSASRDFESFLFHNQTSIQPM